MTLTHKHTLGTALIWLGVSAWAPFLYFLAVGRDVSIFPFLAVHLAGVLGGAALRNAGRAGVPADRLGRRRRRLSKVMIYLGVLAWAPYFYLEKSLGQDVPIGPFLAAHLTGVLGGAAVRASVEVHRLMRRR